MDKLINIPGRLACYSLIVSDKMVEGCDVWSCSNLVWLWESRNHIVKWPMWAMMTWYSVCV